MPFKQNHMFLMMKLQKFPLKVGAVGKTGMQKGVSGGGWKAKRVLDIKYIRYQSKYIGYISFYEEVDSVEKLKKGRFPVLGTLSVVVDT